MSNFGALLSTLSAAIAVNAPAVSIEQQVRQADVAFWMAFNTCDRQRLTATFTPDVEFYHDKTGATFTRNAVVKSLMDGPCGTPGLHVRREAVAGSLSVDAVPGFGAILTGRHRFYARRDGEVERLDGEARFAIVWQSVDGQLRIRRVLSFAHGPALEVPASGPVLVVPADILQSYVGRYTSAMGEIVVTMDNGGLHLTSGGLSANLIAITTNSFRAEGRALSFEFVGQEKIKVLEDGALVAEGVR